MKASVKEDKESARGRLRGDRFGHKPNMRVGIFLSIVQQLVGIDDIFHYSTTLWRAAGFSEKDSFTVSVLTSVTNVVVTIVAILLIDRVGRRPILLVGSIGMTVSLAAMALAFSQAHVVHGAPSPQGAASPIAPVGANLFVTITFPPLAAFSTPLAYGLYALLAALSLVFTSDTS